MLLNTYDLVMSPTGPDKGPSEAGWLEGVLWCSAEDGSGGVALVQDGSLNWLYSVSQTNLKARIKHSTPRQDLSDPDPRH